MNPDWLELDRRYVWHPFTRQPAPEPLPVVGAQGCWLHLADGRRMLDGISSWWVNLYGHAHPHIGAAIARQAQLLEQVIFAGFAHEPAARLGAQLCQRMAFDKVFFSDDGSTAIEVALKMALQYHYHRGTGRTGVLALEGGYHGDTFGAMAVSAEQAFIGPFSKHLFAVQRIPSPTRHSLDQVLAALDQVLATDPPAAFIYEPLLQGVAGMQMYEAQALDALLSRCQAAGVLCIADEVLTGFGRCGTLLASSQANHKPDMVCLSKGLTAGFLPLGATLVHQHLFDSFAAETEDRTFYHGHSFTANPLACAAALAGLELWDLPETKAKLSALCAAQQAAAQRWNGHLGICARAKGPVLALEMPAPDAGYTSRLNPLMRNYFLEKNLLLRPMGNVLYFLPPYCITAQERELVYSAIDDMLHHALPQWL